LLKRRDQVDDSDSDSDESDARTPSEGGDREEFFEALEVLNQHDYFVATSIKHFQDVELGDSEQTHARGANLLDSIQGLDTKGEESSDTEDDDSEVSRKTLVLRLLPPGP
jgi:hypothetical protein